MAKLFLASILVIFSTVLSAQNSHIDQVKAAMKACTAMTQHKDVKGRNLAKNIQAELGDNCVVKTPSNDSIRLLNKQIKHAFNFANTEHLWEDVNDIALERTAKSVWASHMKLIKNEKLNQASAIAMICKHAPGLCRDEHSLHTIKSAYASFEQDTAKHPIKFMSGLEQATILKTELQPLINRINKTCEITRAKYNQIRAAHSCIPMPDFSKLNLKKKADPNAPKIVFKPVKPMNQLECDEQLRRAHMKHKKLESIAKESMELDMQMIVSSKLGSLFITEDLRDKLGTLKEDFTFNSCMKGEKPLLGQIWNKDLIQARVDFYNLTVDELKKIQSNRYGDVFSYDKKQTLKQYIKTNPSTIAELLRKNPDPNNVYAMCNLIKTIQGWDKTWQVVDGVIIGTGIVASIALGFTGIGAPAGAALAGIVLGSTALAGIVLGSTALSVSKSAIEYGAQLHQDSHLRAAVATRQKNLDQGLAELQVSDERKQGYIDNIKYSVAGEVLGFGVGKGLKVLKNVKTAPITLKVVHQKLTKMYVGTIKAVTKNRSNFVIAGSNGVKLNIGSQLGKGSRGVVSDITSFEGLPNLNPKGQYVAKLAHTLKGQSSTLNAAAGSLKRELIIYDEVAKNLSAVKSSAHYPKNPAWGESLPLCKIHHSMSSPEGLVLIKDKIKGKSLDKLLAAHGGKLPAEAEKSLKEIYDLNQALYEKQKILVNGKAGNFSGDIAKANLMWIDDAASLKQLGFKRPGFVLLELDIHYKNGPKFIKGNMSFDDYKHYVESN